jgi:hypothetical protein
VRFFVRRAWTAMFSRFGSWPSAPTLNSPITGPATTTTVVTATAPPVQRSRRVRRRPNWSP